MFVSYQVPSEEVILKLKALFREFDRLQVPLTAEDTVEKDIGEFMSGPGFEKIEGGLDTLAHISWLIAESKGFHRADRTLAEEIALMHSELSEALEADRKSASSDKISDFDGVEEELADLLIRVMDSAASRGLDISGAVTAKLKYNADRPYLHGKKY